MPLRESNTSPPTKENAKDENISQYIEMSKPSNYREDYRQKAMNDTGNEYGKTFYATFNLYLDIQLFQKDVLYPY